MDTGVAAEGSTSVLNVGKYNRDPDRPEDRLYDSRLSLAGEYAIELVA